MAFPSTGVLDNFNRADTGPPPSGSWVTSENTGLKVISNQAGAGGAESGGASWNTSFAADQEAFVTLATPPPAGSFALVYARLQTATDYLSDHYEVDANVVSGANNDVLQVWKRSGGTFTQLGADITLGADLQAGDVVGIRVVGSTVEAYLNGVLKGTRTDTDVSAAGYVGVDVGEDTQRLDDFGGGPVPKIPRPPAVAVQAFHPAFIEE